MNNFLIHIPLKILRHTALLAQLNCKATHHTYYIRNRQRYKAGRWIQAERYFATYFACGLIKASSKIRAAITGELLMYLEGHV